MGETFYYGLSKPGAGESLADDNYKYTTVDRDLMDRLLKIGAELHRHTGTAVSVEEPSLAPTLTLETEGGTIGAGLRVYYKYSYLNDIVSESKASPEAFIDTPDPVNEPSAPTLTVTNSGGTLGTGNYAYVLSAFSTSSNFETKAINVGNVSITSGTANVIRVNFPSYPAGALGFNVYRRAPNESRLVFLATVDSPDTFFDDDGTVDPNTNRTVPKVNSTNAQNAITITLPGATPSVPEGYTWRVYRTVVNGNYVASRLADISEYNVENDPESGVLTFFTDIGYGTRAGNPLTSSLYVNNASQIILDDATEVQGELPPSNVNAYLHQVNFAFVGLLEPTEGQFPWFCEFDQAKIIGVRAVMGRDSSPFGQEVIFDVLKGVGQTNPTWDTIFPTADPPTIGVGDQYGTMAVPDDIDLSQGDMLLVDVVQEGDGATPSDVNAVVSILMWVRQAQTTNIDWT